MANARFRITFVQLAAPLDIVDLKNACTVEEFLGRREIQFGASVRVNRKVVAKDYVLKNGDMISLTKKVSGG